MTYEEQFMQHRRDISMRVITVAGVVMVLGLLVLAAALVWAADPTHETLRIKLWGADVTAGGLGAVIFGGGAVFLLIGVRAAPQQFERKRYDEPTKFSPPTDPLKTPVAKSDTTTEPVRVSDDRGASRIVEEIKLRLDPPDPPKTT